MYVISARSVCCTANYSVCMRSHMCVCVCVLCLNDTRAAINYDFINFLSLKNWQSGFKKHVLISIAVLINSTSFQMDSAETCLLWFSHWFVGEKISEKCRVLSKFYFEKHQVYVSFHGGLHKWEISCWKMEIGTMENQTWSRVLYHMTATNGNSHNGELLMSAQLQHTR